MGQALTNHNFDMRLPEEITVILSGTLAEQMLTSAVFLTGELEPMQDQVSLSLPTTQAPSHSAHGAVPIWTSSMLNAHLLIHFT